MMSKAMRRHLITAGLLLGTLTFAACGSSGPGVQARQTGDTTESTTTTAEPTTTTAPPTTAAPETSAPETPAVPTTSPQPPCSDDALGAAYTAAYGGLDGASLRVQKCVDGWATSSQAKGFNPPSHALYRADGDHWVALNKGGGKLCTGHGVPPEVAPQIGCET
jgi:hypothetical protein